MKQNKLTITIDKPIDQVFERTTNPNKTHLRIDGIEEEIADDFPPSVGTIYKNCGKMNKRDTYTVVKYEKNKVFTLSSTNNDYIVEYSYIEVEPTKTQMSYHERVEVGDLSKPFEQKYLVKLKGLIENDNS